MEESDEEVSELKKLIIRNKEYLKVAYSIPNVLTEIKIDTQHKFWELLQEKMEIFTTEHDLKICENSKHNPVYSRDYISRYYLPNQTRKFYGMEYLINRKNNTEIRLRIEMDYECPYWGIIVEGNEEIKEEVKKIMKNLNFNTIWSWPFKYLNNKEINFKSCDFELVKCLNSKEKSEKFIEQIVNIIKDDYLKVLREINFKTL